MLSDLIEGKYGKLGLICMKEGYPLKETLRKVLKRFLELLKGENLTFNIASETTKITITRSFKHSKLNNNV